MKKNFDIVLKNLDGSPLGSPTPVTMGRAICEVLMGNYPEDQELSVEQKISRSKLAHKVHAGGEQDYTVDELTLIKDVVGKRCIILAIGQIFDFIEAQ